MFNLSLHHSQKRVHFTLMHQAGHGYGKAFRPHWGIVHASLREILWCANKTAIYSPFSRHYFPQTKDGVASLKPLLFLGTLPI